MQYKIGDHVVIEKSNIEELREYAGKTGVIDRVHTCDYVNHRYSVIPDDWEDKDGWGIWCKVKCLVKPTTSEKIVITTDGKTTTAALYKGNEKIVATADCSPEDTFDFNVGAKLAMERLMAVVNPVTFGGFKVGDRVNYKNNNGTVICIARAEYPNDSVIGVEFDDRNAPGCHNCGGITLVAGTTGTKDTSSWFSPSDLKHGEAPKYYNGKVVCVDLNGVNRDTYTVGKIYEFTNGRLISDDGYPLPYEEPVKSFREFQNYSGSKWLEIKE